MIRELVPSLRMTARITRQPTRGPLARALTRTVVALSLACVAAPATAESGDANHPGLAVEWMYFSGGGGRFAIGDLDGDRDRDLAVLEPASERLSVWLNDGRGRFEDRRELWVGPQSTGIAILDADGDRFGDIALGRTGPRGGVEVRRGLRGGRFSAPIVSAAGIPLNGRIVVADMNSDGLPDLVGTSSSADRTVGIALNARGGSFVAASTIGLAGGARALAVADFDGDSRLDVAVGAVAYDAPVGVTLLRGDGAGGLEVTGGFQRAFDGGANELVAVDLDADGDLDFVSGDPWGSLGVHLNQGAGGFTGFVRSESGFERGVGLALGQLDEDRAPELIVSSAERQRGSRFDVYQAGEDPALEHGFRYSYHHFHDNEAAPNQIAVGDLDGDGRDDLALLTTITCMSSECQGRGGRIGIVRSRPDRTLGAMALHPAGPLDGITLARFSGSASEVVMFGSGGVSRARFDARGRLEPRRHIAEGSRAWALDADGDGRDDLAIAESPGTLVLRVTGRDGDVGPEVARLAGSWIAAGDLGGHPGAEIVYRAPGGGVAIAWSHPRHPYRRVTDTGLVEDQFVIGRFTPDAGPQLARIARDAQDYFNSELPIDTVCVYRVNPSGKVVEAGRSTIPGASRDALHREVVAAELDGVPGDDLLQLAGTVNHGASLRVVRNRGAAGFVTEPESYRMESEDPADLLAEDLDGDGDRDVAWTAQTPGSICRVEVLWNNGAGRLGEPWMRHIAGSYARDLTVGDLDGDGVVDLALATHPYQGPADGVPGVAVIHGERRTVSTALRATRAARPAEATSKGMHPRILALSPNPVREALTVRFTLPAGAPASIELFDLNGRRVHAQPLAEGAAGERAVTLAPGRHLPVGVYWLTLRQGAATDTRRLTLLR